MKSDTLDVRQVFQDRRQYRVPFYQRAYVWTRADQWERLWEDVQGKAEARLLGQPATAHFLGAVVLEPQARTGIRGVETFHIIDGQQRLTTLQYLLHGLRHALEATNTPDAIALVALVAACLRNQHPETMLDPTVECFKVWPTFRDRDAFQRTMTATTMVDLRERFPKSFRGNGDLYQRGVHHEPALEALWFFYRVFRDWITEEGEPASRAEALVSAVLTDLSLVCISLGPDDDAQVIFETLNGHAAKLHATDLIRNFVFMRAGNDAERLYETGWRQFESSTWSVEQTRGRLKRPRLEWFVQSALQARTGLEVDVGRIYHAFRDFAFGNQDGTAKSSSDQIELLSRLATPYLELVTGVGSTPIARFGERMAPWDASTMHSLALRIAISEATHEDQNRIFQALESFVVRRAVCGLSNKYYNRLFQQMTRQAVKGATLVELVLTELARSTADSSRWPRDDEFRRAWMEEPIHPGKLDLQRVRAVLVRLESRMRTPRTEEPAPALTELDVEHILPQSWFAHWPLPNGTIASEALLDAARAKRVSGTPAEPNESAALARGDAVPRMGNLTLLSPGLNRGIQNHSFHTKREGYFAHSNLHLNRGLMRLGTWDEEAVAARGAELARFALQIWPGPS